MTEEKKLLKSINTRLAIIIVLLGGIIGALINIASNN